MSNAEEPVTRAYGYHGHTVISANLFHDDGTQALRSLVEEVGGVRPVARMLEEDPDRIGEWTRGGLPKPLWAKVKGLLKLLEGTGDDGLRQNPSYNWDTQFSALV